MVGCVLVKNGKNVGEGYHRRFGGPHAEALALQSAGPKARKATAYVTLEPCCYYGKTPACTDALIEAGVSRVIAAMTDPNPRVRGRGFEKLQAAGIETAKGLCHEMALSLTAPFVKLQQSGRPWVILKWAQSLDGKIATRTGDSQWITNDKSRRSAHQLRGRVDAVVVGVGTVLTDDPLLDCRHVRPKRLATRIVLDSQLRTPLGAQLVTSADRIPTLIVTDHKSADRPKAKQLLRKGVELLPIKSDRAGLHPESLLDELGRRTMTNIMVEGGGRLLGTFYDRRLADEAHIYISRRLIGGEKALSPLNGQGPAQMSELIRPYQVTVSRCGEDDLYRLVFNEPPSNNKV
jgi:diaminohydroxyphosphoribosylaminopyrimidine deaminase/5-amino-6-(5-phosphoribosylamino)uracil reductase